VVDQWEAPLAKGSPEDRSEARSKKRRLRSSRRTQKRATGSLMRARLVEEFDGLACKRKHGEVKMLPGAVTLLCRLVAAAAAPTIGLATYALAAAPIASTTLLVNDQTNSVTILRQINVAVTFAPAEYQDLQISKSFYIVCRFPFNPGPYTISVRVDNKYNLIPVDVVEYKKYDPSYIELDIDTLFLTNRIDDFDFRDHKVYIDFFAARR